MITGIIRVLVLSFILILNGFSGFLPPLPFFLPHPICAMYEIIKKMAIEMSNIIFITNLQKSVDVLTEKELKKVLSLKSIELTMSRKMILLSLFVTIPQVLIKQTLPHFENKRQIYIYRTHTNLMS